MCYGVIHKQHSGFFLIFRPPCLLVSHFVRYMRPFYGSLNKRNERNTFRTKQKRYKATKFT